MAFICLTVLGLTLALTCIIEEYFPTCVMASATSHHHITLNNGSDVHGTNRLINYSQLLAIRQIRFLITLKLLNKLDKISLHERVIRWTAKQRDLGLNLVEF